MMIILNRSISHVYKRMRMATPAAMRVLSSPFSSEESANITDLAREKEGRRIFGKPLKVAVDLRSKLGRELTEGEIPKALVEEFDRAASDHWISCDKLFITNEGQTTLNMPLVNEVLEELEDDPFCNACEEFHEEESYASCFGMYHGPGGYVGTYGDGGMPTLDPSDPKYRGSPWED